MNAAVGVNKRPLVGKSLEQAFERRLREILGDVSWLKEESMRGADVGADVVFRLSLRGGVHAGLRVYVKSDIRPGVFRSWAEQHRIAASRVPTVSVLATPFVSPRLADLCREAGWSWYDLAGNCWIDVPGLLHIERAGNPPLHRRLPNIANLSTPAAARVMRALLSPVHAGHPWTQRALQASTCWQRISGDEPVSLGLVNKVVRHLRDEGFIEIAERGFRVRDPMGLLAAWREVYRFDRHQRHSCFTLLKGAPLDAALHLVDLHAGGFVAYAAFSAAERQAPQVRQGKTWLYVGAAYVDMVVNQLQAKEVDSGENLVLLVPDDSGVFIVFDADSYVGETSIRSTDPVQTYVDLFHAGGRGEDAAKAVLEQRIRPAWARAGLA
jgi:Transcriptional regulator, AbiEi antitoxin, Type IV TA system